MRVGGHLLEANVQVKGHRLPRVADWGKVVLQVRSSRAGDELHRVRAGVVSHLRGAVWREE